MKKFKKFRYCVIALLFVLFSSNLFGQSMPSFQMKLVNGKTFSSKELSHQKPVLIIYFAPDCEHCQVLLRGVKSKINEFSKVQLVLVSFEPETAVAAFVKQYQFNKVPNLIAGTELPVFFFKNYYQLQHTPFTALFNKKRQLVISYKDFTPLEDLVSKVKKLK